MRSSSILGVSGIDQERREGLDMVDRCPTVDVPSTGPTVAVFSHVMMMTKLMKFHYDGLPMAQDPPYGPGDITPSCHITWQPTQGPHSARTALRKIDHTAMI